MDEPIFFEPIFQERVWGGRRLETLFGKALPPGVPIGESWEIVDREEAQSVAREGRWRGRTLGDLWGSARGEVFGPRWEGVPGPFPLLIKLLDARDVLSVQVHPPASVSASLGGEPKTEMWYLADADEGACLYAGLRRGATRAAFERALREGGVEGLIHRIPVRKGDAIFIPSGRIHAIGAGTVIVEVQQNSDTTYRVYDWDRLGLDGKPRALHIGQSLASIDFSDFEPGLAAPEGETVVTDPLFRVERWELAAPRPAGPADGFAIFVSLDGEVDCAGKRARPGEFFLVPACALGAVVSPANGTATALRVTVN